MARPLVDTSLYIPTCSYLAVPNSAFCSNSTVPSGYYGDLHNAHRKVATLYRLPEKQSSPSHSLKRLCYCRRLCSAGQQARPSVSSAASGFPEGQGNSVDKSALPSPGSTLTAANDNSEVYSVSLQKPMGIVFEEAKDGAIFVSQIVANSHASKTSPSIAVGDRLLSTTAQATQPNGATREVIFETRGEKFETVMAAILSNVCARCFITLSFQRSKDLSPS
eukprot:TRINITY_DN5589_c3_g1_i1.p1 TRINITY_DN5589_c3_g1~~TRINITY_DN5589_c3_g1_i1.p1  ORF type:complete len:221 (-),score=10.02 TRINITY_DN5589_c3_g1_i1:705-1367(-)